MPIYEFNCRKCGESFEELVRDSSRGVKVRCPHCESASVARKLSAFAAHSSATQPQFAPGACRRCGDPNGPCAGE